MINMLIHIDCEKMPPPVLVDSYNCSIFSNLQTNANRISKMGNHQTHAPNEKPWSILESTDVMTAKTNNEGKYVNAYVDFERFVIVDTPNCSNPRTSVMRNAPMKRE